MRKTRDRLRPLRLALLCAGLIISDAVGAFCCGVALCIELVAMFHELDEERRDKTWL